MKIHTAHTALQPGKEDEGCLLHQMRAGDHGQMPQLPSCKKGREKHLSFRVTVRVSVGACARALRTVPGTETPRLLLLCWQYYLTVLEVGTGGIKGDERKQNKWKRRWKSGESTCPERWLLCNQKPAEQENKYSHRFLLQLLDLRADTSGRGPANPLLASFSGSQRRWWRHAFLPWNGSIYNPQILFL